MAVRPLPIRIGDTFRRVYRVYNPKPQNEWADPSIPEADTDSPFNFTGYTVTFHIKNLGTLYSYTTASGVTVASGTITIRLETAQTALFKPDMKAESFVKLVSPDSTSSSKFQFIEQIIKAEDL